MLQEQLVNEQKSIYVGLVMVEKKYVEVCVLASLILSTANRSVLLRLANNRALLPISYRKNNGKL